MTYLLGLDVGTTGAKAVLINVEGKVVASATEEYPMYTPRPLWAEQNPEDWWQATQQCFRRVLSQAQAKPEEVRGVGLTGQMHGLVLLDQAGNVLRPCIMWNDQRTAPQCAALTEKIGMKRLMEITANPVLPGFTAPKILWVRENEPAVYERAARMLLPKDYIRYRLTGEYATEVSDAAGTSLLDVKHRRWSDQLLQLLDIPKIWMPPVYESVVMSGKVSKLAAASTGLPEGTPVVGGGGDQAAGAVGNGIVLPGVVSVTIGTSGVVFAHTNELMVEQEGRLHVFCHAVPGAWHVMGVTLAAGGSFRWFRDTLGQTEMSVARLLGVDPYEILVAEAEQAPPGSEGLLFLPYLSGERTPYPDPNAKGVFCGLTVRHTKSHFVRAVIEGVSYSLRDCLELIKGLGLRIEQVRASGGGARSALWRQILAEVFDAELVTLTSTEGAPYGAALLAGVGTGVYSSVPEACERTLQLAMRIKPDPPRVRLYQDYYALYRQMYTTLKPTFDDLSQVVSCYAK
jgi:xylulokinase